MAYSALIYNSNEWLRRQFNSYYVDYIICDKDFVPVCVIELDGIYHREEDIKQKDERKDQFWEGMENNGLIGGYTFKFFRIPYNKRIDELKRVFQYLAVVPQCDVCGEEMAIREKSGEFFFGCHQRDENGRFLHKTKSLFSTRTMT